MSEPRKRSDLTEPVFFNEKDAMTAAELFQHLTLRPILKFQNELLCRSAIDTCLSLDPGFRTIIPRKQRSLMDKTLAGNQPLRSLLTGIVVGMMDPEQLLVFLEDRKDLSKRIQNMVRERIMEQFPKFL